MQTRLYVLCKPSNPGMKNEHNLICLFVCLFIILQLTLINMQLWSHCFLTHKNTCLRHEHEHGSEVCWKGGTDFVLEFLLNFMWLLIFKLETIFCQNHQMLLKQYYFWLESYVDTPTPVNLFLNNCSDLHLKDTKII